MIAGSINVGRVRIGKYSVITLAVTVLDRVELIISLLWDLASWCLGTFQIVFWPTAIQQNSQEKRVWR